MGLAEYYLRSALANTPVTSTAEQFGFHTNEVERKRIPGLLKQLEQLGVPRTEICTPLWNEILDALRRYGISKDRFYKFGRSVKLMSFLEHRRTAGVIFDTELAPPVLSVASAPPKDGLGGPIGQAEMPARNLFPPWETMPLQDTLNFSTIVEEHGRTPDKYHESTKSIHERSSNWMNEVPQTRYDRLYAIAQPDLQRIGIRRVIAGDQPNAASIRRRDRRVMARSQSAARRVRLSVESQRTHREE